MKYPLTKTQKRERITTITLSIIGAFMWVALAIQFLRLLCK